MKRNSPFNRACEVARCDRLAEHYLETGHRVAAGRVRLHQLRVLKVDHPEIVEKQARKFGVRI